MAEITAAMVKELREKTDAPMMECKKALTEADGDIAQGRGDPARQARQQGEQGGLARDRRRRGRHHVAPTASWGRWSKSTARPTSSPRTTISSRSPRRWRELVAEQQPGRRRRAVGACARRRAGRAVRTALVGKIGENMSIRRFERCRPTGRHRQLRARRRQDRRAGGPRRRRRDARQGPRDAHRRRTSRVALSRDEVPAELIDKERDRSPSAEGGRVRQAGRASSPRWSKARCRNSSRRSRCSASRSSRTTSRPSSSCSSRERREVDALRALRGGRGHREEAERLRGRGRGAGAPQAPSTADGRSVAIGDCRRSERRRRTTTGRTGASCSSCRAKP